MLLGALIVQMYIWAVSFPKEKLVVKLVVYGVFLLELASSSLLAYDA